MYMLTLYPENREYNGNNEGKVFPNEVIKKRTNLK